MRARIPCFPEVPMFSLLLAIIYLTFISLGLPDCLLGSAWPVAYTELGVPMSWSGVIFMIISFTMKTGTRNMKVS